MASSVTLVATLVAGFMTFSPRTSGPDRLGYRRRFFFEIERRHIGEPADGRMQLQPQLAAEKSGIHSAHPRLPQAPAALAGGQRQFVAIFLQALAHGRFDGGDIDRKSTRLNSSHT